MIIIGEKINGFIPKTLAAIEARDEDYIRFLATEQTDRGAAYLDICAGVEPKRERETLLWLLEVVQAATDTPICLDSSDARLLVELIEVVHKPGIINSISLEKGKCETVLPVIAQTNWKVIALTCDDSGTPDDPAIKLELTRRLLAETSRLGISHSRVFIDPLVTTLATKGDSLANFTKAIECIKAEFPAVHITSGLSNISFGMPHRKAINMQFLAFAMAAGMDSAIMDPLSADIQAALYATNALLGRDDYCMEYITAFRQGLFKN